MSIEGHPPWWDRKYLPYLCVPCRAGDHRNCRPFTVQHVLHYCECIAVGCAPGSVPIPPPRQER